MGFVYILEVCDPEGLSPDLPDHEAISRQRDRRLAEPSERLSMLLARIRQQPLGVTVNVVGGPQHLAVEWGAEQPGSAQGEGACFAHWTLMLPMEDDVDALQDAAESLTFWAEELGLRVFDVQRD